MSSQTGLTPAITYGPNRRIGAMGAYVVTIDLKESEFVPAGGWISCRLESGPEQSENEEAHALRRCGEMPDSCFRVRLALPSSAPASAQTRLTCRRRRRLVVR